MATIPIPAAASARPRSAASSASASRASSPGAATVDSSTWPPGSNEHAAPVRQRDGLGDGAHVLQKGRDLRILEAHGEPLELDPDQPLARGRAGHEGVVGGDPAGLGGVEDGTGRGHGYRDP